MLKVFFNWQNIQRNAWVCNPEQISKNVIKKTKTIKTKEHERYSFLSPAFRDGLSSRNLLTVVYSTCISLSQSRCLLWPNSLTSPPSQNNSFLVNIFRKRLLNIVYPKLFVFIWYIFCKYISFVSTYKLTVAHNNIWFEIIANYYWFKLISE